MSLSKNNKKALKFFKSWLKDKKEDNENQDLYEELQVQEEDLQVLSRLKEGITEESKE